VRAIVTAARVLSAAFQWVQSTVWCDPCDAVTEVLHVAGLRTLQVDAPSLSPHTRAAQIADCRVDDLDRGSHAASTPVERDRLLTDPGRHPLPSIEPPVPE